MPSSGPSPLDSIPLVEAPSETFFPLFPLCEVFAFLCAFALNSARPHEQPPPRSNLTSLSSP